MAMRPLSDPGATGRVAPFAGVAIIAVVLVLVSPTSSNPPVLAAAAVLTVVLITAALCVPWVRVPAWCQAVVPLSFFAVLALLRHGEGGATSGYGPVVMLPILWLAIYGSRAQFRLAIAGTAATFLAPLILVGPPLYPSSDWRGSVLWVVIGLLAGSATHRLVDQSRQRHSALAGSERWLRALVSNLSDVVLVVDPSDGDRRLRYVSPAVQPMFGLDPAQLTTSRQLTERVHPDDARQSGTVAARLYAGGPPCSWQVRIAHTDGSWRSVEVSGINLVQDPAIEGVVLVLHDVTERERLAEELLFQASHDVLTGLPNRRALVERLARSLARADRRGDRVGLLMLDLDGFKLVNDTFGHGVGDELLVLAAQRLGGCAWAGDLVYRLGGDEFAVVLEPAGGVGPDVAGVVQIADRVMAAVREPFLVLACPGHSFQLSASMGIVVREPHDQQSGEEMVRDADLAMYVVKGEGKDGFRIFDPTMRRASLAHLDLEEGLRRALRDDELVLHYQPIVDVASGQVHGVEALVRWQHPQRGLVGPNEFIPVAEASGLIVPIGRWVLATACAQLSCWHQANPDRPRLRVSVNVSPRQLGTGLLADVAQALASYGLDPGDLLLEITESLLNEELPACLTELAERGVRLSVDDFGTGYSSLSRLTKPSAN